MDALTKYYWPGNVRELENFIEYAINFERGTEITYGIIGEKIDASPITSEMTLKEKIDAFEKQTIEDALTTYGHDVEGKKKVAQELEIGLRTLYRKLETLGIS